MKSNDFAATYIEATIEAVNEKCQFGALAQAALGDDGSLDDVACKSLSLKAISKATPAATVQRSHVHTLVIDRSIWHVMPTAAPFVGE